MAAEAATPVEDTGSDMPFLLDMMRPPKKGRYLLVTMGRATTEPWEDEARIIGLFPHADLCRARLEKTRISMCIYGGTETFGDVWGATDELTAGIIWMAIAARSTQGRLGMLEKALRDIQNNEPRPTEWVIPQYATCGVRHWDEWPEHMALIRRIATLHATTVVEVAAIGTDPREAPSVSAQTCIPVHLQAISTNIQSAMLTVGSSALAELDGRDTAPAAAGVKRAAAPAGGSAGGAGGAGGSAGAVQARLEELLAERKAAKNARVEGGGGDSGGGAGGASATTSAMAQQIRRLAEPAYAASVKDKERPNVDFEAIAKRFGALDAVWSTPPASTDIRRENVPCGHTDLDVDAADTKRHVLRCGTCHKAVEGFEFHPRAIHGYGADDARIYGYTRAPTEPLPDDRRMSCTEWFEKNVRDKITTELIRDARSWGQSSDPRWMQLRYVLWTASRFALKARRALHTPTDYDAAGASDALVRQLWHTVFDSNLPYAQWGIDHEDDVEEDVMTALRFGLLDDLLECTAAGSDVDEPRRNAKGEVVGVQVNQERFGGVRPHVTLSCAKLAQLRAGKMNYPDARHRPDRMFVRTDNRGICVDPKSLVLGCSTDGVITIANDCPIDGSVGVAKMHEIGGHDPRMDDGASLDSAATKRMGVHGNVEDIVLESKNLNSWPNLQPPGSRAVGFDSKHWCQVQGMLGLLRCSMGHPMRRGLYAIRRGHAIRIFVTTYCEELYGMLRRDGINFWYKELLPRFTARDNGLIRPGQTEPSISNLTITISDDEDGDVVEVDSDTGDVAFISASAAASPAAAAATASPAAAAATASPAAASPAAASPAAASASAPAPDNIVDALMVMIKPTSIADSAEIIDTFEAGGKFQVEARRTVTWEEEAAGRLYAEHRDKAFFNKLVEYTCSGPTVVMRVRGDVDNFRNSMLPILRRKFGNPDVVRENAVHASKNRKAARQELMLVNLLRDEEFSEFV